MARRPESNVPLVDRVIRAFSPEMGARRARARLSTVRFDAAREILEERRYDGASAGRRTDGWVRTGSGANAEVGAGLVRLRNASRDLTRNNPWAGKALDVITNYVVGQGIEPEIMLPSRVRSKRLADAWQRWAGKTECDADGMHNMAGLQALAMRAVAESGEVLIRRRQRLFSDGLTVPLQLQVLEGDFLDQHKTGKNGGNQILQGIEFGPTGKREAYWLFGSHPGESGIGIVKSYESRRIPAEDIIHVYRMDRPGQVRGVPWGHRVLLKLKDLEDANDNYLLRQKIAACFTMIVYGDDDSGAANQSAIPDTVEPGGVLSLPGGKEAKFATPPGVEGFGEFSNDQLYAIASGYGITFEALTGKLKGVNFLSGRIGQMEMAKNVTRWQAGMFVPRFCDGVMGWFALAADLMGIANSHELSVQWVLPTRDMLDPQKEFKIEKDKIRSGKPLFDSLRGMGYTNPEQTLRRKQVENELLDELGLVLDVDPRHMSAAGNAVTAPVVAINGADSGADDEDDEDAAS